MDSRKDIIQKLTCDVEDDLSIAETYTGRVWYDAYGAVDPTHNVQLAINHTKAALETLEEIQKWLNSTSP